MSTEKDCGPTQTETDMLQRAAIAVRNLIATNPHRNRWATWVPEYLDRMAVSSSTPENVDSPT